MIVNKLGILILRLVHFRTPIKSFNVFCCMYCTYIVNGNDLLNIQINYNDTGWCARKGMDRKRKAGVIDFLIRQVPESLNPFLTQFFLF